MSRAAKNAGTIRHRPDGCWEARINLGRDRVYGANNFDNTAIYYDGSIPAFSP